MESYLTMKNYKLVNNLAGWATFLLSAVVYILTTEPSASFWDCGEFILSASKCGGNCDCARR